MHTLRHSNLEEGFIPSVSVEFYCLASHIHTHLDSIALFKGEKAYTELFAVNHDLTAVEAKHNYQIVLSYELAVFVSRVDKADLHLALCDLLNAKFD